MASHKPPTFLRICQHCGDTRYLHYPPRPSGLCRLCVQKLRDHPKAPPRQLSFAHGCIYDDRTLARFWKYVSKDIPCECHDWENRCWQWTHSLFPQSGYGQFAITVQYGKYRTVTAHRFAYQAEHWLLPHEVYVLHTPPCILRHCVRHLYAGTAQQNTNDAKSMQSFPTGAEHARVHHNYNTAQRGEQVNGAVFTATTIIAIRKDFADGMPQVLIAKKYGGTTDNIWRIVHKKTWKHVS